jgi:thioredoxin reductase/NAD-dependent dihydropyrimidine dehydrogenase PreA subunit
MNFKDFAELGRSTSMAPKLISFILNHIEMVLFLGIGFVVWVSVLGKGKKKESKAKAKLQKAIATQTDEPLTLHPEIDPNICVGCGGCTTACPEGDILQMINNKAVLVAPTKCVGHGACEVACPMGAIELVFGTKKRGMDIPRLTTNYESNVPGVYIAGELGGMGLIRNAVRQGALAARHAMTNLKAGVAEYDVVIVGAGPAGLAAGLVAIEEKKKYLILEQNSFGGTVFNFPRQKLTMTKPAQLPIVGTMKFPKDKVTKEQLLDYWETVRTKVNMKIKEKCRFEGLSPLPGGTFEVKTSAGMVTAKKVILAMGVRGTPRRLGLPNEDLPKVAYNLIDAEQYKNQSVVVVGGGNAGVEAACSLAAAGLANKVHILVRSQTFDRCNEENQKLIMSLHEKGRLQIWFNSSVKEIHPEHLIIIKEGKDTRLPNNFLFVFAGAEIPSKFLVDIGVQIEKKFGQGLQKAR